MRDQRDGVGPLRHRLAYQTASSSFNALRQPVETWATLSYWRAAMRPSGGREALNAQQMQVQVTHVITTRHPGRGAEFNAGGRFVDVLTNHVYNITYAADASDRGAYLDVYAVHQDQPAETGTP